MAADWQKHQQYKAEEDRKAAARWNGYTLPPGGSGCFMVFLLLGCLALPFVTCASGQFDPFLNRVTGRATTAGPDDTVITYLSTAPHFAAADAALECDEPQLDTFRAHMADLRRREQTQGTDLAVEIASIDPRTDGDTATAETTVIVTAVDAGTGERTPQFRIGYRFGLVRPDGDRWLICSAAYRGER